MPLQTYERKRRGAVLPLVAVCLVALIGLIALAIDIGILALARSQCQNAADAAALAGARTLNGNSADNYGYDAVPAAAVQTAVNNSILGQAPAGDPNTNWNPSDPAAKAAVHPNDYTYNTGDVKVEVGAYTYFYNDADPSKEGFKLLIPRTNTDEPYGAVRATVRHQGGYTFGRILGSSVFTANATAVAVHRPRDVVIIMDLSGSMRFQSLPGRPYSGTRTASMNPESVFPKFGHYADTSGAGLQGTSAVASGSGEYYDPCNISSTTNAGPPILEYFFSNAVGVKPSSANRAFTRSPDSYATTPGGDNYLKTQLNTGGSPARTVREFNNYSNTTIPKFEVQGYDEYQTFNGYTEGPGYWGKTFFVWPPCPGFKNPENWAAPPSLNSTSYKWCTWNDSHPRDWRQRFYVAVRTSDNSPGVVQHNEILFNTSSPYFKLPGTNTTVSENGSNVTYTFRLNYAAILYWLQESPVHFPSTIQAGRIRYYTAIPSGTDNALNNRWWTTQTSSLPDNERFWKEYIDFVMGYEPGTNANSYSNAQNHIGNGAPYVWSGSSVSINELPEPHQTRPHQNPTAPYLTGTTGAFLQTGVGGYSGRVNGGVSSGSSSVRVDTLPSSPSIIDGSDYVSFGGSGSLYKITDVTNSRTRLWLSPSLNAFVSDNASVSIYASNGAVGTTTVSVTGLSQTPVPNRDYVVIDGNRANPYLVTAATTRGSARVLTLSPPLTTAVAVNGATVEVFSPYMSYSDDIRRPKHHLWFGPMTWVDWLGNYNQGRFWWPGNVPEAQAWSCKVGIQTAIDDIKNNHPNDFVGLSFFSSPRFSRTGSGQHNQAIVPLSRSYQQLKDSLWFPPTTVTGGAAEITPWDEDFDQVPRAKGGTAPGMSFMIAYNLFSSSPNNLRFYAQPQPQYRGVAGGLGRKGAGRIIIFETDGAPNVGATRDLVSAGSDSYYPIRIKRPGSLSHVDNSEWPSNPSFAKDQVYDVVKQICRLETASPPGYATSRRPVQVYALAYGTLFDPANSSDSDQKDALEFLQTIQYYGNTATTTSGADFPSTQRIYGTSAQRVDRMQQAFTRILQGGVQVTLIE